MAGKGGVKKPQMPKSMNFLIGGVSGMMTVTAIQPADLLKTRMQLLGQEGKNTSAFRVASDIVAKEGFLGFYAGLTAALLRSGTYTTTRLGCFNAMLDMYTAKYHNPTFPLKVLMGMGAGSLGAFFGTPADVALIRMTADGRLPPDKRRNYKNVFNALGRIIREEGVRALWTGVGATITRAMIVNGAQLGSYAQARQMLLPFLGDNLSLHVSAAMIAGLVTTIASLPVDIVKTRVQNSKDSMGQLHVLLNIVKNEGILALWSGMLPTYVKIGPATIIMFVLVEQFNALYLRLTA